MQLFGFRYESVWWYVFGASFLAAILTETFRPYRKLTSSTARRWVSNGALLGASSVLIKCLYGASGVALALTLQGDRYGLLNEIRLPYAARVLIGFASLDLLQYFVHRLLHASFLWHVHQVHHSENDLDATTGFRFHPGEALISQTAMLAWIALAGVPAPAVLAAALAFVIQDVFTHANLVIPDSMDSCLRWVIVTPGMHRAHHSDVIAEQNTNFGTIFSAWDRCFGTYLAEPAGGAEMRFGLAEFEQGSGLHAGKLLIMPFRRARRLSEPRLAESVSPNIPAES